MKTQLSGIFLTLLYLFAICKERVKIQGYFPHQSQKKAVFSELNSTHGLSCSLSPVTPATVAAALHRRIQSMKCICEMFELFLAQRLRVRLLLGNIVLAQFKCHSQSLELLIS
jgi:hypothetical protein